VVYKARATLVERLAQACNKIKATSEPSRLIQDHLRHAETETVAVDQTVGSCILEGVSKCLDHPQASPRSLTRQRLGTVSLAWHKATKTTVLTVVNQPILLSNQGDPVPKLRPVNKILGLLSETVPIVQAVRIVTTSPAQA